MSDNKRKRGLRAYRRQRQAGVTAVEVSFMLGVFFLIVCGTLELARTIYIFNTLQEVTRRAASELVKRAPADPDSAAIVGVRRRAIFQTTGDALYLADPVTIDHVRVDYMSLVRESDGSLKRVPTSPAPTCSITNRRICMSNPNSPACVRFVRVRICTPGSSDCTRVPYQTIFPFVSFNFSLPRSSTVGTVETFGYAPGTSLTCL